MFDFLDDLGIELNPTVALLSVLLSGIFIAMIWLIPTWGSWPLKYKIIVTIVLPIISYVIISYQLGK